MFCPKCGKGEQAAEAYCRNCGVWLPEVNKLIKSSFGGDTPVQNVNNTIVFNIISAFCAAFITFVIYSIAFGFGAEKLGSYYGALLFVAGAMASCILGWQITSIFISLKLRRRIARRKIGFQQNNSLNEFAAHHSLPAADYTNVVRPFGVTENTTTLLEPTAAKQTNSFD